MHLILVMLSHCIMMFGNPGLSINKNNCNHDFGQCNGGAAGRACDAVAHVPSALQECAIESDTLFQLSRRSRGQRIAKPATFRPL